MHAAEPLIISFESNDVLGKGREGTVVRKGHFGASEEPTAFKLIPYESYCTTTRSFQAFKNRVENEVRAMEAIKGIPGVVQLRYFNPSISIQGKRYALFGQSLAENGDLFELVNTRGRLQEKVCRSYFQSLLNTLICAHRCGVVHRDIKLENLFLNNNYMLEVGDWEMAGFIDSSNQGLFSDFRGTVCFMPPENFTRQNVDGVVADIWAASICLFIMLTGIRPFTEANYQDPYFKSFKKNNKKFWLYIEKFSKNKLSDEAIDLLNNLLQSDPSKRLISMDAIFSHPWMQESVFTSEELSAMMETL